jgi:hypothetical protein
MTLLYGLHRWPTCTSRSNARLHGCIHMLNCTPLPPQGSMTSASTGCHMTHDIVCHAPTCVGWLLSGCTAACYCAACRRHACIKSFIGLAMPQRAQPMQPVSHAVRHSCSAAALLAADMPASNPPWIFLCRNPCAARPTCQPCRAANLRSCPSKLRICFSVTRVARGNSFQGCPDTPLWHLLAMLCVIATMRRWTTAAAWRSRQYQQRILRCRPCWLLTWQTC